MGPFSRFVLRREVVVNLIHGGAVRGVLYRKAGPLLVLKNASLIESGDPVPVDGDVIVERSNVEFVQVL